ncbi:MAG: IS66 family insertion sequence element accessory protein TnpB [Clostridia bacterium]
MSRGLQMMNHSNKVAVWSERIATCRSSGQTVGQWCQEAGIPVSTYYNWQRKLFQKLQETEEICFAEVPTKHISGNNTVATLHIGGACVELYNGANTELIHSLVEALKSC